MTQITDQNVAAWQQAALEPGIATMLEGLRGWAGFALYDLGIGWNGSEVVIPTRGPDGAWAALYYQPDPAKRNGKPKLKSSPGATRALWPPLDKPAGDDWTVFVEGESDAIAAYSAGLHTTGLPGASAWRNEWAERFADRRVAVIFDSDKPGRKAAAQVAADLAPYAAEVRIVDLDPDGADGYDLTDELLALGLRDDGDNAGQLLRRRIADTAAYQPDAKPANSDQPGDSWRARNLLEHAANPPTPPAVGGCLYAGKRHVLSGEPESGKSWLALGWCHEILQAGGCVVYIDHEMGASMTLERLRVLGANDDQITRFRYVDPTEPANFAPSQIIELVTDAALVVIDSTIGSLALHGLDPNSGADIERWYQRVIDQLRAQGAAIVVLDHVTKNADTRGMFAIGSERKTGVPDVHLSVEKIIPFGRDRAGKSKVIVKKDRPGHLARPTLGTFTLDPGRTAAFSWEAYSGAQVAVDGRFRPTVLMERVSEYVERFGPVTKNQIESNVTGKADYLRKAIEALHREAYIAIQDVIGEGGKRAEISSVKPFREATDEGFVPVRPGFVPDEVAGVRPGSSPPYKGDVPDVPALDGLTERRFVPLEEPCPSCSSPTGQAPHQTAGGTYCCHDCARGDACACKYTNDQEPTT